MGRFIAAVALSINAIFAGLLVVVMLTRKDITYRYYVSALIFTLINILAIAINH